MKKLLLLTCALLLVLAGAMFVASCSSDDDEPQGDELWQKVLNLKSATIIQYTIKGRFMSR